MIAASFHAPRFDRWGCDYDALLRLVDASCRRVGIRHAVITDAGREPPASVAGIEHFPARLPENLMRAILEGQRQFLAHVATQGGEPVLLIGADCLVVSDPRKLALPDVTITTGPFSDCRMNTGAIWCASPAACVPTWAAARDGCAGNWGDDQTSLLQALEASQLAITEVPADLHNRAPDHERDDAGMPTVAHFRGNRKAWMGAWARRWLDLP